MKKVLIITYMLNSGGVEVSLLNFIKQLKKDSNIYIKLLVLRKSGAYKEDFEKIVDIDEIKFDSITNNMAYRFTETKFTVKKLLYKFMKKYKLKSINKKLIKHVKSYDEEWDLAIDYHGYGYLGTAILVEKIKSRVKISFIHDEKMEWLEYNKYWFDKIDYFYAVSESCVDIVKNKYPEIKEKIKIFHNIIDKDKVKILSRKNPDILMDGIFNLLTVGRLEKQKGYDILIETADILKRKNINFKWYIIGAGKLKKEIEKNIRKRKLEDIVILLGMKKNPYVYMKNCDIYVQTSIHEGYGIAIAEARVLCKPIVASKIKCIEEQINNNENGIISDINAESFAEKILELYVNRELMEKLISNLIIESEKKEDFKDMKLIYECLGEN